MQNGRFEQMVQLLFSKCGNNGGLFVCSESRSGYKWIKGGEAEQQQEQ